VVDQKENLQIARWWGYNSSAGLREKQAILTLNRKHGACQPYRKKRSMPANQADKENAKSLKKENEKQRHQEY
jgi:hypothetical protein